MIRLSSREITDPTLDPEPEGSGLMKQRGREPERSWLARAAEKTGA
jgi:hypothetical protein